jgi:hypothetical protein
MLGRALKIFGLCASIWAALGPSAKAEIQSFDISGTDLFWSSSVACSPPGFMCAVYSPGKFTGQVTIDLSTNSILAGIIVAENQTPFANFVLSSPSALLPNFGLTNHIALMSLTVDLADNLITGNTNAPVCAPSGGCGRFITQMNGTLTAAVPEPSTWAMLIVGFASIGAIGYRRRRARPLRSS